MKETDEERAVRQAKLQKALSAAYLSHQIDELESQVQHARLDTSTSSPRTVVVLDASALLFAPKRVRDAVKVGKDVVVPLEVFHALDLLKKGPSALAVAARVATRYIEHASRQAQSTSQQSRGLRMQRPNEAKALVLPSASGSNPPKWVTSVLSSVAHYAPNSVLWIAKSTLTPPKPGVEVEEAELRYAERATGEVIQFWAGACGIETLTIKDPSGEERKDRTHEPKKDKPKPQIKAPPVLLKRELKPEAVSARPATAPMILQRPTRPSRTIGRYLDNDEDDEPTPPPKADPAPKARPASKASATPRGGFTLLKRAEVEARPRSEPSNKPSPKVEPKVVLLQRPKG